MVEFLLPRFVHEGKKYATIAIGCTGGQHRSVYLVERLAAHLRSLGWRVAASHREQTRWGDVADLNMAEMGTRRLGRSDE
jgi:UPF0042 nucleotide-binding protein